MNNNLLALAPLACIAGASLLVLLLDAFLKKSNAGFSTWLAVVALAGSFLFSLKGWARGYSFFEGALILDRPALIFLGLLVISGILVLLIGIQYISAQGIESGAYQALFLLSLSGLVIMVSSFNLLVIFLGMEVFSLSGYALAALKKTDLRSAESAVKYFMMGSLAAAFFVFGLAFLYGASRSLDIPVIAAALQDKLPVAWTALLGLGLVLVGIGFKIGVVPFHMWVPDVYEGAPTPITALFSIGPKAAGFAVLLRLLSPFWAHGFKSGAVKASIWAAAVLTMTIGNLAALRQKNIKRLLAYSSIAHSGYILIAILTGDGKGLIFYLLVYLFMNIGAFSAVLAFSRGREERLDIDAYTGLGFRSPWLGAMMSVFFFSLAGFPPTGGFLAKFMIFRTAVDQGFVALVVIAVLNSLVSVYYYLRLVVIMYTKIPSREESFDADQPAVYLVLFLCLYGVLQLGISPGNILALMTRAMSF